jgi:hypothetical protein
MNPFHKYKLIVLPNRSPVQQLACQRPARAVLRDRSFKRERRQGTAETRRSYRMLDADAGTVAPNISQ